jgi:hypothetical protein
MLSTAGRELHAAPVSHSAGTGSFDSANTSLREVLATPRMTLWVSTDHPVILCALCGKDFDPSVPIRSL